MMKGYRRSHSQIDSNCEVSEINRAIELLEIIRPYVEQRNFSVAYINALNQYLKIVPTPLGMQIEPYRVYRSVEDVDYQMELLNSLLTTPAPQAAAVAVGHAPKSAAEPKVVSLKTISCRENPLIPPLLTSLHCAYSISAVVEVALDYVPSNLVWG